MKGSSAKKNDVDNCGEKTERLNEPIAGGVIDERASREDILDGGTMGKKEAKAF